MVRKTVDKGKALGRRVDGFVGCLWLPATSVVTRVTLGSQCHAPNPCITLMILWGTFDKNILLYLLLLKRELSNMLQNKENLFCVLSISLKSKH